VVIYFSLSYLCELIYTHTKVCGLCLWSFDDNGAQQSGFGGKEDERVLHPHCQAFLEQHTQASDENERLAEVFATLPVQVVYKNE
jgi:hypothetical protein